MPGDIEKGKDSVAALVAHFRDNADYVRSPEYKEADVRQEFIDPFFIALGWDVHNEQRLAPQNREVIPEPSIEVEGSRRAPDYVFRLGQTPKFFAEAKKPGVSVKDDPLPAYQLRRYAWSAKLPLSLLTDFAETALYDCRIHPKHGDKAAAARVKYVSFEEYADRWREIWDILSREAVWSGAFDKFTESGRGKRGTSEVDAEFLGEIEFWREALARNIALRNPKLSVDDLNAAVQLTIDRIIFLRMAEDRGIEVYEQLLRLADGSDVYPRFIRDICRRADDKYNSGLFDLANDRVTPGLAVDDKVLKGLIPRLYFPVCPYEFSVMPVEILGSVYERFLGKVIRLTTGHQARIEDKPEVKKAGGVYYTPSYIVDYIVKNTVGKWLDETAAKRPASRRAPLPSDFRVLDMACGSGSFLLGAYKYLLDYCLKWYEGNGPERFPKAVVEGALGWRLTTGERKRILVEHIFGVDIDHQAVEVTKLSLLLKVLEGESGETLEKQLALFHERALPDLEANIKCGNSLIGPDYFTGSLVPDPDEMRRVNPFDWKHEFPEAFKDGGFDCVIGNPPYGATLGDAAVQYARDGYESGKGGLETYALFMEKALSLCATFGRVSMIVPTGWYSGATFGALRRLMARSAEFEAFVNLPYDVFDAWVDTTVFVARRRATKVSWPLTGSCAVRLRTFPKRHRITSIEEFDASLSTADMRDWFAQGGDEYLTYADKGKALLLGKVEKAGRALKEFADVQRGVTPFSLSDAPAQQSSRPAFAGTVRRYVFDHGPAKYIRFDDSLAEPKPERYFIGERLLLRELISRQFRLQAVKVEDSFVTNKSLQSILALSTGVHSNYLLGLVNSRLLSWYFLNRSQIAQRDDFPKIVLRETRTLPIRAVDLSSSAGKSHHDQIVALVEQMLELHKRLHDAKSDRDRELYTRQIEATDREIDRLVYELYELTDDEIRIVEGTP